MATAAWVSAGEPEKRKFDVPGDLAEKSLRVFSVQSGSEVLFSSDAASGVRTNAIKGEFLPGEAVKKMLTGTTLYVRDERDGVFRIAATPRPKAPGAALNPGQNDRPGEVKSGARSRDPPPGRSSAGQPNQLQTSQPRHNESPPVKNRNVFSFFAGWLAAGAALDAQTTSASQSDQAMVLSPFTVSSERDTGYQASSTLAGTRLNTPVKDLGASLSIYTKDFVRDLGVTSANELLVYATNMEAAGPSGNYSGATGDINSTGFVGEGSRSSPQNATRTRGLATPNLTADLFTTAVPLDTYNTESVSVIRGPNAVLFGAGSPAGVIEQSLIRPLLSRDQNRVEVRAGDNESFRSSLDLNRVLKPGALAFRLAGVYDNNRYDQRPSFEEKKRLFGAVTWQPTRSTVVRGSFETGNTRANRPLAVLPLNSIAAEWYAAGMPVEDWRQFDDPARNPNAAAQNGANQRPFTIGQGQLFTSIATVYSNPSATTPDMAFLTAMPNTTVNAAYSVRGNLFHPTLNRDSASDSQLFVSTLNTQEIPAGFWPGGVKPAGLKLQGFTDLAAYDWRKHNMDESGRQGDTFRTFSVTLEQRALNDHVGVELSFFRQRFNNRAKNPGPTAPNGAHVRIDTTVTLPDGTANPNLGRPFFVFGQSNFFNNNTERESRRATVYARYDFKELSPSWGKWLGRHTATGLFEEAANQTLNVTYRMRLTGDLIDTLEPNNLAGFNHRAPIVVYVGNSILGGQPLRLESIRIPEITSRIVVPPFNYFNAAQGSPAQGELARGTTSITEILAGGSAFRDVVRGKASVLQSYWLDDHLVTVGGIRRDDDFFQSNTVNFNPAQPDKVFYGLDEFKYPRVPRRRTGAQTKSASAVLRWPQKLVRLPQGADLSVFINRSDNFNPSSTRVDVFATPLESPQGRTREYGLNLSLWQERLILRVNRFESSVAGQSFTPAAYNPAYNQATLSAAATWERERNLNPGIDRSADIALLFSALPANFRNLYQYTVTGSAAAGNISSGVNTLAVSGVTDTTDFEAKGTEIELVFNPTRRWRMLANISNQDTVQSNIAPNTRAYVKLMQPVWDRLANVPLGNYPQGHLLGTPLPVNVQTLGQYVLANVLTPLATTLAADGVSSAEQRKWRANFVTNYTFNPEGRLRGWSVGGAVRWQDKVAIGYPAKYVPSADGRSLSVALDLAHPYYDKAQLSLDSWLGYTRSIWQKRIQWTVRVNAVNLVADQQLIAITAQPWGAPAQMRVPPERRWYLTNSFGF